MAAPEETRKVNGSDIPQPLGWEDSLTGLEGPDFWQRILVAEIARSSRYACPMAVVVVELEGVLEMFESWGGDVARRGLREAAQCLRRTSRTSDYCTRIGLTRFGVVLTETDEIAAINFVERVRESGLRGMPHGADTLRFRFGWASPMPGEAPELVVRRAERRLLAELLP